MSAVPDLSIVIPVYNEERLLRGAVTSLLQGWPEVAARLGRPGLTLEILLAENGSSDRTAELAAELAAELPEVSTFSLGEPNYGKALRRGLELARGTFVICEEIDLCDFISIGAHSSCSWTSPATSWWAARPWPGRATSARWYAGWPRAR